jgi:hypothetical protein
MSMFTFISSYKGMGGHRYLFSNTKERMLYGQPEVKAKAGGKAQRRLSITSPSRV